MADASDEAGEQARLIDRTVDRLSAQTQLARRMQEFLSVDRTPVPTNDVAVILQEAVEWSTDTYPGVRIETSIPDSQLVRAVERIDIAFRQVLQNAVEHADSDSPEVSVSLATTTREGETGPDDPTEVVEIRFVDDGPGIPPHEIAALDENMETALEHGSGIGLWCVNWLVENSGGELSFPPRESGTEIVVTLPITEHEIVR